MSNLSDLLIFMGLMQEKWYKGSESSRICIFGFQNFVKVINFSYFYIFSYF